MCSIGNPVQVDIQTTDPSKYTWNFHIFAIPSCNGFTRATYVQDYNTDISLATEMKTNIYTHTKHTNIYTERSHI